MNVFNKAEVDFNFIEIMKEISKTTIVDFNRCYMLYQFLKATLMINGDIAEVGVYKGGTAKLFSKTAKSKQLHLFDTFEGMPETNSKVDKHKMGDFKDTSLEKVKIFLEDCNNVNFYKGIFPNTITNDLENKLFSFVHIDADIYKSIFDCCCFFYDRLTKGAIMIFDDYGFLSCPGAKLAVDDFFSNKQEQIIYLFTGQCFVYKL